MAISAFKLLYVQIRLDIFFPEARYSCLWCAALGGLRTKPCCHRSFALEPVKGCICHACLMYIVGTFLFFVWSKSDNLAKSRRHPGGSNLHQNQTLSPPDQKKAPRIVAIWELDAPWCLPGMQGPSSQCWNGDVSDVTLLILVDPACYGVLWGIRCIRCRRAMCLRWYSFVGKYHRGEMKIDEAPSTVQPSLNSVALWIRAKELNACNFM